MVPLLLFCNLTRRGGGALSQPPRRSKQGFPQVRAYAMLIREIIRETESKGLEEEGVEGELGGK